MVGRLISLVTWLLVAGSLAIIMGGLTGRPVLLAAVPTSSMVPALKPGDLILVLPLFGRELSEGQIVVYKSDRDKTWIVHRIVGGDEVGGFVAKGDANDYTDPHRVLRRHVAGTVPVIGGRVVKAPGLGALSLDRGPLANPYVASTAMVLGIYLLVSDQRLRWGRSPFSRRRRERTPRSAAGIGATYLALGLGVATLTYLSYWSLSSHQAGTVEVVAQRFPWSDRRLLLPGESRTETTRLENPSFVPLIVNLRADDSRAEWSPSWLVLPPHSTREATLTLVGLGVGEHRVVLRQSVLLPFLPVGLLRWLGRLHWHLPAMATALVPLLLMAALALTDRRVASGLRRLGLAHWLRGR